MKFLDAVGPIAISKSVWSQLLDENEKGRSVTSFQDVSLDGIQCLELCLLIGTHVFVIGVRE